MDDNTATRTDAVRFLEALAPDGELTFATFTDGRKGGQDRLARTLYGSYWRNFGTLAKLNAKGAAVCLMVNRGDGKGRKAGNVQAVRALFLDLDGAPLAPVLAAPLPPAIVCESSPGKHHAYWPVANLPLADFPDAQRALAVQYGGDAIVCDLPRVMRLPGYVHAKGESFTSRLVRCDPTQPWQWHSFAATMALPFTAPQAADNAQTYCEGERNAAMYRFACGLRGQGLGKAEALRRAQVANAGQYVPPLDEDEVAGIIASAWRGESTGFLMLPHSLLDSDAFHGLPHTGKVALVALARKHNGANNGRLAFTRKDAKAWGLNRYQRTAALDACELSDLIECTARGLSGAPGHRATPDLFRLLFVP